jgi:hypothetical protein
MLLFNRRRQQQLSWSQLRAQVSMEMKMNATRLMAGAIVIGIGVNGAMSNASAQVTRYGYLRSQGHNVRTYRPPEGQTYQRAFRNAPTRQERARQDFELDGTFNGN